MKSTQQKKKTKFGILGISVTSVLLFYWIISNQTVPIEIAPESEVIVIYGE